MSETNIQLATTALGSGSFDDLQRIAKELSASGLMGKKEDATPAAVFGLMLLCQCDGLHPVQAMRRYHIIEGKPSMRADAMLADFFAKGGGVVWHVRSDDMVAGTFFQHATSIDDKARERANKRFETVWSYDTEPDPAKRSKFMLELAKLSHDGEETMLRTYADCEAKGITQGAHGTKTNWAKSPRQMLTARCITEGIRLVMPGLIAGIYEEGEVRDMVDSEPRQVHTRESRDLEAMKAIVAEHQQRALATTDSAEKSRLLSLASELRIQIQEIEEASKVKVVPPTHVGEAVLLDAKTEIVQPAKPAVEAKVDSVEPPTAKKAAPVQRKQAASTSEPAPGALEPQKEQQPASEAPKSADWLNEPYPADWREYRIRKCTHAKYFGKKLGEMNRITIGMMMERRGTCNLEHPDEAYRVEAKYIVEAYKVMCR